MPNALVAIRKKKSVIILAYIILKSAVLLQNTRLDPTCISLLSIERSLSMIKKDCNMPQFAILGSPPLFSVPLHVNAPNTLNRKGFEQYIAPMFESGWLSNSGPLVQRLEDKLADYLNVKNCVVCCNGTSAMSLVISSLGLKGEVILPSFNFISTAHTLMQHGIKPIFCDIDPSGNICVEECERLISSDTSAIIATHLWGQPCAIEALEKIAKNNNIHLLFDAAHAFSCSYKGRPIGSFGDAEVFSFHATKSFHTFEGGAITTNNNVLADKLRKVKNFGFIGYDKTECVGTNAKMTEVCAAMGLANLDNIKDTLCRSQSNFEAYKVNLLMIPGIDLLQYDNTQSHNFHYIVTNIDEKLTGFSRDQLIKILHAENIIARKYFSPGNHMMEPYKTLSLQKIENFTVTDRLAKSILLLPGGPMVTLMQISEICQLLKKIIANRDQYDLMQSLLN